MHLTIKTNSIIICGILLLTVFGCRGKSTPKKYAAKVGSTYLLQNSVDNALSQPANSTKYREEFIHRWVETELLYKEAQSMNILNDSTYQSIVEHSKKELAAAMLLQKVGKDNLKINDYELLTYFDSNKNDFKIADNAVVINYIKFDNEQSAIKFRSTLLKSNWQQTLNIFAKDSTIVDVGSNLYLHDYEISPPILLRYINNINPGEVGIVIKVEPNIFVVAQTKAFLKKGDIPDFSVIKNLVYERYLMIKKKKFLRNYINKLYSKYDVEIKKGN